VLEGTRRSRFAPPIIRRSPLAQSTPAPDSAPVLPESNDAPADEPALGEDDTGARA
jgi:hypothetical protein